MQFRILFVPEWFIPGKMIHYFIRYGVDVRVLRIVCIASAKPCGPLSNEDLTHNIRPILNIIAQIIQ